MITYVYTQTQAYNYRLLYMCVFVMIAALFIYAHAAVLCGCKGRKVIIFSALQHFTPEQKDQTKTRGQAHINTHKHTHTSTSVLQSPAAFSYHWLLQLPHVWSLSTERARERERCSGFYLHQVIRHMQLTSLSRINMCVCTCGAHSWVETVMCSEGQIVWNASGSAL